MANKNIPVQDAIYRATARTVSHEGPRFFSQIIQGIALSDREYTASDSSFTAIEKLCECCRCDLCPCLHS